MSALDDGSVTDGLRRLPTAAAQTGVPFATPLDVLDALPHAAFIVEVEGDESFSFAYGNHAYRQLLDREITTGELRALLPANALVAHMRAFARAARDHHAVRFEADWSPGASPRTLAVEVAPIAGDDGRSYLLGAAYEVTDRRSLEQKLAHRTRHDPLTELPNRVMLLEWLQDALDRCAEEQMVGLLILDLDHFKVVNDSLGHAAGDALLGLVAQRVDRVLRAGDTLARLGGDELAIVCHRVRRTEDVVTLAARVRGVFDEAFVLGDREVFVGASVGVAVASGKDLAPADLLRNADVAVFAAKELGRGRVEVFDDSMRTRTTRRLEVEAGLRRSLVQGELRVHYQPVVDFDRCEVVGFEALVRWEHPEHGITYPDDFLGIAEETGLIVPMGTWVLEEACAEAARWAVESAGDPFFVSVNISARQLGDPGLARIVEGAMATAGLDPSLLVLEIAESVLVEQRETALATLRELSEMGVRVAIDAFGAGQSSLGYLKTLPVHTVKMDRSIVASLGKDPEDAAIVRAIVDLAHALGRSVAAVGVETSSQLLELRSLGCDVGQGYYFARPQPSEIVRALVHNPCRWSERFSRSA